MLGLNTQIKKELKMPTYEQLENKVIFYRVISAFMLFAIAYIGSNNIGMGEHIKQLKKEKQQALLEWKKCESDIVEGTCLTYSGLGRR